jgi:DcuC family C4-dicarboxylate transporter
MMIKRIPNLIILGIAMIYLLKSLIAVELLETLLTVTVAGGLVLCLIFARGINGIVSYVLFFMSLILLITFHAPWEVWMVALKKNVSLIVLYVLVPFLSFPLYYGEYIPAFNQLFTKYIYNKNRLYIVTSLLTSILAIVASIGAQHIVNTLVTPMKRHIKVIATGMTRGYICAMCWAPSMIPMIVVMNYTGASWKSLFPGAFFIAACLWLLGFSMELVNRGGKYQENHQENKFSNSEDNYFWRKLIEFGLIIILFIATIFFTQYFTEIDVFAVVAMISMLISLLWSAYLRSIDQFLAKSKEYISQIFSFSRNEIFLFWVVGFFGVSLDYAGFGNVIVELLEKISGGNPFLLLISMIVLISLTCLVGAHPMIPAIAIAGSVNPVEFGFSKELFSLVLISGWVLGSVVSPLSTNNISAAGLLGIKTFDISFRWNMVYGMVSILATVIILLVFRELGL